MKRCSNLFNPRAWLIVLIPAMLVVAGACKKSFDKYYNNTGPASVYLYAKLQQDSNFSIFTKGLERVGLDAYINAGGLYTVFAPTNTAFNKYFAANGYQSIADVPNDVLFRLLNFHIVNNLWYYYSFQQRYRTYTQTLYLTRGKKFVTIDVTGADTLKINGVPVIKALRDISADNGVIHGIGNVIVPLNNLEQVLQSDPQFAKSTFYRLMQVMADSTFDRFNSYDKNRDGRIDSVFYKTYSLLSSVYTSIEFRQNTTITDQGGDPVFTTILMPSDDSLNAFIAPAIAKIDPAVPDKIAALSPTYVQAAIGSYFMYDTLSVYSSSKLINKPVGVIYYATNGEAIPTLAAPQFTRTDVPGSNGTIPVINRTFPQSDRLKSALGQASMDTSLSMFMMALQNANLMTGFEITARTGTYFAPTNAAFRAAGFDVKNKSLNGVLLNLTQFQNILKNHVIDQNLATPASLTGSIATNFGNANTLTFSNGGSTVTTTTGIIANVTTPYAAKGPSSGYVYKVDQILVPNQY
ncbi:MAG: fasciclin domain-containing protein [Bacteroidetes bacterium]|nr:fasciclin domain-containing protein [Bacteroidota bacterium]